MMRPWLVMLVAILLMAGGAGPAGAAASLGVVLLHGKTGTPEQMAKLAATLKDAGYAVSTPEMCWSKSRIFDKALPDCLKEVDAAVAGLKSGGASRIVIGGVSQGAIVAIDYGATRTTDISLDAVVADPPDILLSGETLPGAPTWGERVMKHPALRALHGRMRTVSFPAHLMFCGGPNLVESANRLARARRSLA